MDKNAIKKFAVWARRELIARVSQRAAYYGITEDGYGEQNAVSINDRVLSETEQDQRRALVNKIQDKGYKQVIEEVAYTWFNRFAALRFMEVNNYLPSHVRVFTDVDNHFDPQILNEAINIDLEGLDLNIVYTLKKSDARESLYKYLLITQCNALSKILPGMFQTISDYTELLFPDNLLREGSVIEQMITLIPEEDWTDQVQIIGWLYQYYNTEPKDKVFADLKKNIKITKEKIPAATQLFTPDWIVRYMVENSLGRLWLEGHPAAGEKFLPVHNEDGSVRKEDGKWNYYLEEASQEPEVEAQLAEIRRGYAALTPEEIRVIDPCCGSGHILCYLFDVLEQIYEDYGYTAREAAQKIVQHNLHGLDIDPRAVQLSYFAVMMKARQYDRRFFSRNIQPMVYSPEGYPEGMEYGSLITVDELEPAPDFDNWTLHDGDYLTALNRWSFRYVLSRKYDVVVTNPPYMGIRNMYPKLVNYLSVNYPASKYDMFSAFIQKCKRMTYENRFFALITQNSWMFINSFEALRLEILEECLIRNMNHLGFGAFGADFGTTSFVCCNQRITAYKGRYVRLGDYRNADDKENQFYNNLNRLTASQDVFYRIPRKPFAYWISESALLAFDDCPRLGNVSTPRQGMASSDNKRFVRFWPEVSYMRIGFNCSNSEEALKSGAKWFPYNNGGDFRKWYGNNSDIVNWENDGYEVKEYAASLYKTYSRTIKSISCYFLPGGTWNAITSTSSLSVRYFSTGFIFSNAGMAIFSDNKRYPIEYIIGFLNSTVADHFLKYMSPTLNYNQGDIALLPIKSQHVDTICRLSRKCIEMAKKDWDSFTTSWDFQFHPLIAMIPKGGAFYNPNQIAISECYMLWEVECEERFQKLKTDEEELNRIFIDIYGLQDELTPQVEDKDVTVRKADLQRDIRSFISYAVGCMFGRYSLDMPGLAFAGGNFSDHFINAGNPLTDENGDLLMDENGDYLSDGENCYSVIRVNGKEKLTTFAPDYDNILPICDDEYFEDDIVRRFAEFVETVYGKETLEENLKFIADALGGKGSPREVIRNYFLNDFYADHLKVYQKRPIYWLFDSGKKNGFKCLIYMHRYQPDTIARIRTDYVHEQQSRYCTAIADLENRIAAASTAERVKLSKQLAKLQDQSEELRIYEEKIHHLADQMIPIDLDDGVKVNYAKFQDVLAKIK